MEWREYALRVSESGKMTLQDLLEVMNNNRAETYRGIFIHTKWWKSYTLNYVIPQMNGILLSPYELTDSDYFETMEELLNIISSYQYEYDDFNYPEEVKMNIILDRITKQLDWNIAIEKMYISVGEMIICEKQDNKVWFIDKVKNMF